MITLNTLIHYVKDKCKEIPNVGCVLLNDVYELNALQNVQYSTFVITQQQHYFDTNTNMMCYKFVIFYVDRLTESKNNELDVQSMGVQLLHYLVQDILETSQIGVDGNYTFTTFTEKFDSLCAGAFCEVTFIVSDDCNDL